MFKVYASIARFVSLLFLLAMILILIDFAYNMQEWIAGKIEEVDLEYGEEEGDTGLCQNKWKLLCVSPIAASSRVSTHPPECDGDNGWACFCLLSVTSCL